MNTPTAPHRTHRRLALLLTLITASVSPFTPAGAQTPVVAPVPPVINYQGRVTDSTGLPIGATGTVSAPVPGTTNRKMIFRIYDAATGGTRLWTEEQTVTIATGEFSVLLGSGINATGTAAGESRPSLEAVFNSIGSTPGTARYLEIMVDEGGGTIDASDVPISPRQQLTTTAYSFRARSADSIASGTDLQLNGSSNYGLGYYGAGRTFNGTTLDGPVLYGLSGGALGSVNGASQSTALRWNATGQVGVGSADLSGADATSKLVLQGDDAGSPPKQLTIRGNTTSKRLFLGYNTTSNYGALQAYSGTSTATNLLLNPVGGTVGIGTTNPTSGAKLEVNGAISATTISATAISATTSITTPAITANVINLPTTTSATVGVLTQNGSSLMHTRGTGNFFAGPNAGNFTFSSGHSNTATGHETLSSLTTGQGNVGNGYQALKNNSSGTWNTAVGNQAMLNTTQGSYNSAFGQIALTANINGIFNTALGYRSLYQSTTGNENSASGAYALGNNLNGNQNTAHGSYALRSNVDGNNSTAAGWRALYVNTTGSDNTAIGSEALVASTTGSNNIGIGRSAGSLVTSGSNNICIGNMGAASDSGVIRLGIDGTHTKTLLAGNVGIGTASPTKGKLEVIGSTPYDIPAGFKYPNNGQNPWGDVEPATGVSIYADGAITCSLFVCYSDGRIKRIEGISDAPHDLTTLMGIQVTDYSYIDSVAKGSGTQKKVIAQQVEKVFPQAITKSVDVVPDIYQKAAIKGGWVTLATDLKVGERVRLIGEKEEALHEVLEVREGAFRTAYQPEGDEVFVYGREVNDFRSVDYDAISMLNVSATQQIKKEKDAEVKTLQEENRALRASLAAQNQRLAALEARDAARDAKLAAIEKRLSADRPAVRTVSLKQGGGAE